MSSINRGSFAMKKAEMHPKIALQNHPIQGCGVMRGDAKAKPRPSLALSTDCVAAP